ncbi:TetR/AcrR family transcriptional regulator [Prescottella equi]|uniref:TetR/AcrR family transcriptional regulator n=1 Tax=Rhodococcus hoagii TaxID=43767 RepID=UPI0007CD70A6|nr:TetR/AcrR family transcriptional regulator [Prescottella equi]MBM4535240.1 TetR family transcriptional regulator [Prescottella equi]MBM4587482.1 TetR family transcriptional regulator [Prescottella equi]MBM4695710.1 TetR family transcriptional regulator [Prescottella equi]NKR83547.1 TetR family transcriptional regulator [Prescottella equi]NKS00719.1 TetR family transcriptional regulator [Prescottella equi]
MARTDDWLAGGNRREVAVARITAAATDLFLERGFDRVGVLDVAERAGCSRATLYRYVGGKPAIVAAVVSSAAASVAEDVARAVAHLDGAERVVEAILTSVAAVRADPALSYWFAHNRTGAANGYLASSPDLARFATTLTGAVADDLAGEWIVRVVLTLLAWPGADGDTERHMVRHFVAPAFAT